MFEGWAADVLASYLGKYLDLPRDRLRISLWGGEGILEDVQLRVEAFEYLQLPFVIKEGSVGRLKLQIPWGRWRGGPLVVELSDVVLCVAPREESDWEEGPALRRAQAAKQAQLAAAELAKLGSRVAATGSSSGGGDAKPAATAPAAAGAGDGTNWGWVIADYVLSFLLNRLQFAVKNIHVYFQAPDSCSSEYEAFGVKLASLSTVAAGDTPSVLSLFPALHSASAAAAAAVKVVRQLHVQGWSCYWKPRRQQQQQPRPQQPPAPQGQPAASTSEQQHRPRHQHRHAAAPTVAAQDYLLAPVEAVLQVTVHTSSTASAGGTGGRDSSSAGVLSSGLACDVFLGAGQVGMQLSSQQLVGMARLADDAAVWSKRARYGCYRPPGWITVQQAAQQGMCWHDSWHESRSRQQPEQQEQGEPAASPSKLPRTGSSNSSSSTSSADTGVEELIRSASFSSAAGSCLVPTGRNGVGAPVTWRAVWQYAVHSVLADLRDRRRQQGCWSVQKSDLLARRRYVHLYQQKLDALQPKATAAAADSSTDSTADSKAAEGSTAAAVPAAAAAAAAVADGSSTSESSAALQVELQRLEQQLCVEDILLCRSLAELALERRSSSSDAERCRSWFAWGASSIAGYLYPSAQQASTHSSTTPSKAPTPSKQSLSSGGAGASMPSEADLDELLEILHIRNSSDAGGGAAPREEAAAALEAAQQAAGGRAAAAPDGKPGGLAATALIGLKWQVLRLRAALQDCPAAGATRELLVLDVEGTSITGSLKGGNLSARLAVQDVRLFDCCSDPGVHECVLQRLDPTSPVSPVAVQLLSPSRGWGSGLTGLGLSQAQGLQRMSPEAFGWAGNAMPAVASGAHMRRVTGAPGGASAASSDGRGSGPALLTIGVEFAGSSKGVSVQLEPLQLLFRPGCLVAVNSMLEQLPQDTLQQQLAAARAEFEAGSGQHACSRPAGAAAPSTAAAASAAGPRSVRFSDNTSDQPQEGTSKAAAPGRPQQLPPALLQLQLTFVVSELLLVLPTELHYAAGTNAVLHLQGLKLAAVQGAAAGPPLGGVTPPTHQPHPALSSTSSDGAAQPGSGKPRQLLLQQQQLTLGLTSLFVGLQQPCLAPAWRHSFDAEQPEHTPHQQQQQQSRLLELLKLPPVQGTMWLTGSSQAAPSQRRLSTETPSTQALVQVSLQVPPVSCCLSASMLAALQQAAAVLAWQSQLGLPELVATYHLPLQQQLGMAHSASQQPQEQPPQPQKPGAPTATQAAATVDAAVAECASSRTPSPTESEVAEWLAAAAPALPSSHTHPDAAAATAPQQLRRCDSDKLLPPAAGHSCDRQQQQAAGLPAASSRARSTHEKQQRAQLSQADAAALLDAPDLLLLDLEVLLEELDIQYIHDAANDAHAEPQHEPQQPASSPQRARELGTARSHLRLQASLLSVGFKHSTHGRRAEAGLKDLVLQAGAAAGGEEAQRTIGGGPLPGLLQLLSSVSVEEVQVAWGRQLGPLAVLQEVQVALEGLQIQGQPGDVGLFLLPASADAGSSITAAVRTSTPHTGAAASSSSLPGPSKGTTAATRPASASTYVVVGLQNLALGIDGLLHLAAAVAGPKSSSQGSTTNSKAGAASPTQQQQDEQPPTAGSQGAKSVLTLEVELSQIQLLSCCSSAGVSPPRWQAADSLTQAWQPLQDAVATATPQGGGVACELLLDVPAATFSLQPREQPPPQQQQQQQLIPRLMLQDFALYLPGAPGADLLLPVLHIPRVLLTGGVEAGQQEQQQEQSGFAAVLAQQAECHRLLVPAVASSWRPPQLQHLVQFAGRQEQQWQSWTAAASDSSRAADAAQATRPTEQDGGQAQQGAAGGRYAAEAQRQQELSVEVGDVQLLLLPADGTCDKGLLLHWQQLQAVVLQHPQQQQQQQPSNRDAAAGQATDQGAPNAPVLQRTKVTWQDLTVSAIQQDDMHQPLDSATMQQPQQHFAPEDSGQFGTPPGQHSRSPGLQQAVYWAHDLPAVAWLSQGLSSTGRQQGASARHRQSSHPSNAGAAAAAGGGQAAGSNTLNSHATLSRFLSAQESWRDAASLASSVDGGSGFHTPNAASGSLRSASSWITARSSSLSAALSLQAQQQQQRQPQQQQQQPLRQHPDALGGVAAAAAAALGPGSNIIAAWWQAEPSGQSPSGLSPSSVLPGWGSLQQPPQQQHPSWSGYTSTEQEQQPQAGGKSPPPGRKGVRRSSSFRRGLPMGPLQLVGRVGQQQQQERGAPSVRSSLNIAPSVHSQGQGQHDDGLTDAELEFYSIAGDSEQDEEREQQLSGLGGSPHSWGPLGAGSGAAEEQDAWLHGWDLLPLAGFASRGCQVAASWLLLSLSVVGAAGSVDCSPAAVPQQHPALTLDVWQDMLSSQQAPRGQPVQRQVTDVSLDGLQLQLSSKHWDLVAPCILQAANTAAARPVVTAPQTVRRAAPHQQQLPQGRLSQLHLGLQELQVLLFVSPDAFPDTPLQQPRVLLMCSSSSSGGGAHRDGHSGRGLGGGVQAGQSRRTSSEGFGPWQDPGSEPTTPNAAAGLGSGQAQHLVLPVGAGSSSTTSHVLGCAAQTLNLKLSVELDMQLPAAGRPASLQQLHVPTACVQLGAAPWDAASGRVCAGTAVPGPVTQQEQLLLLLAQGMRVTTGSPAGGLLPGGLGQHLQVCVSSVSGWVSTTRLTLLLNIQQQLMQQLPALNAAAAMAGPSSNAYAAAAAAGGGAPGYISRTELPAATSLTSSASLMNGHAVVSSSVSMRRRSMEQQQSAGPRLVLDSSIAVAVNKAAILISTDEPEPWLLQQQQQLSPGRANGSPVSCGLAAQAAGSARSPGTRSAFGSLAAPTGYAPLSTCSTPLVEVALLPLDVELQLLKPCGSRRKGAAGQTVVQVDVTARLRADVYSVDKLGWEPVLDPWAFKVGVRLTPSAAASSAASGTCTTASIISSEVLELTAAPSCIIASKQLQALAAAAKTWQGEQALMQQLLQHLAAPAAGSASVSAAGAACWLVNETGAPLSYVVADAVMEPAAATAALGTCASTSSASAASSPVKPTLSQQPSAAARPGASARGQATHLTPVPLRVLDVAAAGYFGRFVQQGGVSDASFKLHPLQPGQAVSQAAASDSSGPAVAAAGAAAAAGSSGVKQSQLLYVQAAGRVEVVGPVALSQMGCSVHPLRTLAAGGVLSPSTTPGHGSRRSRQASSLVVEVSRHRYGGQLVSVHSNIQLVNSSGLTLQLGYLSPMALTAQPLPLAVLAPGGSVWLPLQVLQATTPSLCLKPAGLPSGYRWCRALDVYALLPGPSSAPATSGFWYEPAGGRASAPSSTPQYLTFTAQPPSSDGTGGSASPQQADAAAAAAVGSLVLAVGASARPWPAGVAVHDATSTGVSHGGSIYSRTRSAAGGGGHGSSAASSLWQLVVEPPAVLVNQLPVGVEVSVVAGKGEVRGLAALIESRQQLPLYGCEAAYYSKLRVQVPGFHSSSWVPLNAAFASPRVSSSTGGSAAATAAATAARHLSDPGMGPWHGGSSSSSGPGEGPAGASAGGAGAPRQSDVGGAVHPGADPSGAAATAVPDVLQLLDQRQVVLSALQAHQAPQVLQLRTCRNKLTGCLTVTVSCSLWIFNCLGSQIAIRQVGPAAESGGSTTTGVGLASSTASRLPAPAAPAAATGSVSSMGMSHGNSSSSSSQVLWLPPYPWMSPSQGSGSSSDLVGLGTAAATGAGAGAYGPPSLAAAWAAARRSDASGGGSSRSALQRSRSTPSLLASTAGLEFLAATPAQGHAAVARRTGPSSAGRPTGAPAHQRRASRAEQQQHSQGLGLAAVSTAAAAAPAGAFGPSPFAAAASGPMSLAANSAGGSGGLPPTWQQQQQQQHEQRPPLQLLARRSFSASAQLQLNSPGGSIELEGQAANADTHSSFQPAPEITAAGADGGAAAPGPGLPRAVRTRRHSSGLHMLASGKLPQQLLPPLQVPESSAGPPAGCSSYDLLSPTHQQCLLEQMHFQQAAAAAGSTAQLPQYASARDLAAPPASGNSLTAIVLPLMKSDMSGWLPLLAGGDLSQLTAAAAAFAGPVSTAEVIVAPPPASSTVLTAAATSQAAMQQRVAAAAAAADQLLADMPGTQQQRYGQQPTEQALRRFGSPPGSVSQFATHQGDGVRRADGLPLGRAPSFSGYSHYGQQYSQYSASAGGTQVSAVSGPGLAGLAVHQGAAGSVYQMPLGPPQGMSRRGAGSWSGGGFADLAAAAAAAAPNVAGSSSELAYSGLPGSVGGGVSAVPPSYAASLRSPGAAAGDAASSASSAAASAAPVMCGWPVHMLDGGGGSSAPAGSRSGAAGPAMAAAAAGSACGFVELQLCAAPAAVAAAMMGKGVQQLPAQWSLPARVSLLGSQSSLGPCSIVKLPLSVPVSGAAAGGAAGATSSAGAVPLSGGGTAGVGVQGEAVPAAARRRASTRGRAAAGAAGQQEQGACFVSVHTAAIPGGGGAWAVHLLPTYVLVNTLSTEVQLRQYDSELVLQTVAPGGHCCVLWPNGGLPLKLQFRVDEPGWSWSGAASVDAPGEFLVKIRHRSRGETLLLQLDISASSSGIVATLSGRQGGFAPYRIDNCSAEVLHVQQAGCAEQEDVLRPYSSLPYAWDEPSMPHKVLLFLRGHRPLGEFALERVGQVRRVAIPSSSRDHLSRSHTKRLLLITTYAEGPMRVLRVLDTHSHLLQQPLPPAAIAGYAAVAAPGSTGLEGFSSRGSFASITDAAPSANGSSAALSQQHGLSRPSSSSSLQGAAAAAASGSQSARPAATASGATASAGAALAGGNTSQQLTARNRTLQLLSAFLAAPDSADGLATAAVPAAAASAAVGGGSSGGALRIVAPTLDVRLSLDGCGLSLVSDSRELLYSSVRGVRLRFCQDALRNAVGAAVASMRVENTLYGCQYPLMLASPVSRSVFGVVYPPGPSSTARALPAAAADDDDDDDDDADAADEAGGVAVCHAAAAASSSAAAGADGLTDSTVAAAAASVAATSAAVDAVGMDAQSIAHAVADELQQQQQEQLAHQASPEVSPSKPGTAATLPSRQPSRSDSTRFKLQQLQPQQQQQAHAHALQVLQPHHLALGVLATVWRTQPSGVVCVEQLGLQLSPLALSLEGKHLKQLMEFGSQVAAAAADASEGPAAALLTVKGRGQAAGLAALGLSSSGSVSGAGGGAAAYAGGAALQQSWPPVQPPSLPAAATSAIRRRLKLYFEEWFISAITLCISFAPGSWFDPSPAGLASAWSGSAGSAAAAAVAAAAAAEAAAAAAAAQAASDAAAGGASTVAGADSTQEPSAAEQSDSGTPLSQAEQGANSGAGGQQEGAAAAADAGAAAATVAAASSSPLPVYLQMALALAHAEEGAWLTLAPFSSTHTMINTESLVQVLGRHYILAAYQELPKVLASLDIFGDPARLLQALGLGFWNLVTLPAHSARWGPYRSLQRLLRGMRVMAYGVSNSIAKGSKRSKAALLPLAPDGLSWQQQQHTQQGGRWGGAGGSAAMHRPGLETGSMVALRSGSIQSAADAAAAAGGSGGGSSNQPGSGQDLLHVLVAGYSLTFQQLLRSFQSGQPLRGVVRAAAQTLVLPALLLLETSESTASSFVRLLAEQVPGAVALRVPRYVASGQLLRPYDRLESLGRALLHHTPGPFLREEFLGCVELQQGLYAVVTVGHLLLLVCHRSATVGATASSDAGTAAGSSKAGPPGLQQQQQQLGEQLPAREQDAAGAAASDSSQQRRQQRVGCVQYKDPQLVFVLDLRDVMMVAAEGSSLRLLCMAGDPAASSAVADGVARQQAGAAAAAAAAANAAGVQHGSNSSHEDSAEDGEGGLVSRQGSGSAKGGDAGSTSGLRELLTVGGGLGTRPSGLGALVGLGRLQQRLPAAPPAGSGGSSVPTAAAGVQAGVQAGVDGSVGSGRGGRWQTALGSIARSSMTDAEFESAAAGAAAAVAAAVSGGLMGVDRHSLVLHGQGGGEDDAGGAAAQQSVWWGGCKWFVGHQVPCGSDGAALQLQQLLERACQRVETLLASSAWPRQLML